MTRNINAMNDNVHHATDAPVSFEITARDLPGGSVQTVDARELHQYLAVGKDFSTWIKDRIRQYEFSEGLDYVTAENLRSPKSGSAKARPQILIDYHLTLDMAKELAMVERNDRGRAARRYFIECERRAQASPTQYMMQMERQIMQMIEDRVEQTVSLRLSSNSHVAALAYVGVRQLLEESGAVQKGRGGLNRKIGSRMRGSAQLRGIVLLRCPHSNVWLFPRDFADQYMRDEGRALVRAHNDNHAGQNVLHLVGKGAK